MSSRRNLINMISGYSVATVLRAGYKKAPLNFAREKSEIFGYTQTAIYKRKQSLPIFGDRFVLVSLVISKDGKEILNLSFTKPPTTEDQINWEKDDLTHLFTHKKYRPYLSLIKEANK